MTKPTIFISYSEKDKQVARLIRNAFEDREHEVLLFHLEQQMDETKLRDLLQSEIKARDWVVNVDSTNAQNSTWVQYERNISKQFSKKVFTISTNCIKDFK